MVSSSPSRNVSPHRMILLILPIVILSAAISIYYSSSFIIPISETVDHFASYLPNTVTQELLPKEKKTKSAVPQKPLNILILYPDDIRHDTLGIAGTQPVLTPFLDSLARRGIRFTHNCVTTSICWISRATLFTGQYYSRHKTMYLMEPVFYEQWNTSYPALLRDHGYYTGHVGKWQFDRQDIVEKYFFNHTLFIEGLHWFVRNGEDRHITDLNRDDALDFLRQRPKDKPFSLQVAFYAPKAIGTDDMQWEPHPKSESLYVNKTFYYPDNMNESFARLPYFFQEVGTEARVRWGQRFGTPQKFNHSMRNYYRMVTEMDEACGEIFAELERQGVVNETMVIYTADNGFFHSEHGLSGKWFPYEESIRVPLIIWDPRIPEEKRGTTIDEITLNIDLAKTILGAAGIPAPPQMQGRDIADLYLPDANSSGWRKEFFYEYPPKDSRRYIPESTALVRKDFKYVKFAPWEVEQLFNMQADPQEEHDVINATEYADILVEMRQRHDELQSLVKLPTPI